MPLPGQTIKPMVKLGARPDACWLWLGPLTEAGYGKKNFCGRTVLAHRWIWEQLFGLIPDGMVVHHECQNPTCVNPHHLRVCTQAENVREGIATTLTAADVVEIRNAHAGRTPTTRADLARRFGVTPMTISDIWGGKSWRRGQPFHGPKRHRKNKAPAKAA